MKFARRTGSRLPGAVELSTNGEFVYSAWENGHSGYLHYGHSGSTMTSNVERNASSKAKDILGSLTVSTFPTDEIMLALQEAASRVTEGSVNVSSEAMVNYTRAATALRAVCLQLDKRSLTEEMLDRAKKAVEAWVSELQ